VIIKGQRTSAWAKLDAIAENETWATGSSLYAADYRDITSGSNGHPALTGYDLATGLGSPLANNLVPYLQTH
jgi:hypothetical protein